MILVMRNKHLLNHMFHEEKEPQIGWILTNRPLKFFIAVNNIQRPTNYTLPR